MSYAITTDGCDVGSNQNALIQDSMNSPGWLEPTGQTVMPDDHSELVPLLPIPNRTVKRLCADDSAGSRVKVGHRQALIETRPLLPRVRGA